MNVSAIGNETKENKLECKEDNIILSQSMDRQHLNNRIKKEITELSFNGGIMHLIGYAYIENVPVQDENIVYKALIMQPEKEDSQVFEFPLNDITMDLFDVGKIEENYYRWAGFEGAINLSKVTKGKAPLPAGKYNAFIKLVIDENTSNEYKQVTPLGNLRPFLKNEFYSTKLNFLSTKKLLQYNLMVTHNGKLKTLNFESTKLKDLNPNILNTQKQSKKQSYIYKKIFNTLYSLFRLLPINKKRITFASDSRVDMDGNFGFIYEEMLQQKLDLDYKFMLKPTINEKKSLVEFVKLAYWFATSKKIILDDFYPLIYPLKIRKEADLIQVWHAVGAFKTFGYSRIGRPGGPSIKSLNHRNYTRAIVSSKNIAPIYAEGFGIDQSSVVPIGIPRTDVFFNNEYMNNKREELHNKFPFLKGKKVILFAPTFRGNGQSSAHYPYEVLHFEKLYREFNDDYIFLFKLHPFIQNKITIPYQYVDFFYDFSEYREVNDLLFIADILVTDYSSVCFEYALLKKPMIFFSYDVEEYIKNRDFYYEYQSFIPGALAKSTEEIINIVKNKEFELHRIEPFVKYFFDDLDGKSSKRFVEQLIINKS